MFDAYRVRCKYPGRNRLVVKREFFYDLREAVASAKENANYPSAYPDVRASRCCVIDDLGRDVKCYRRKKGSK